MTYKRVRNFFITIFVIIWTIVFHYESVRHFYLSPYFKKSLPKVKFLFPPAGWIMFYSVSNRFGYVEVYGVKNKDVQLIDSHDVFRTRTIGFDNIHRGIMGSLGDKNKAQMTCSFLRRRFPYFDRFFITLNWHPDITGEHYKRLQKVKYKCQD